MELFVGLYTPLVASPAMRARKRHRASAAASARAPRGCCARARAREESPSAIYVSSAPVASCQSNPPQQRLTLRAKAPRPTCASAARAPPARSFSSALERVILGVACGRGPGSVYILYTERLRPRLVALCAPAGKTAPPDGKWAFLFCVCF